MTATTAAVILLIVVLYLGVRIFILSRPMHERTWAELIEDMLLEFVGAAIVAVGVLILPLFF